MTLAVENNKSTHQHSQQGEAIELFSSIITDFSQRAGIKPLIAHGVCVLRTSSGIEWQLVNAFNGTMMLIVGELGPLSAMPEHAALTLLQCNANHALMQGATLCHWNSDDGVRLQYMQPLSQLDGPTLEFVLKGLFKIREQISEKIRQ